MSGIAALWLIQEEDLSTELLIASISNGHSMDYCLMIDCYLAILKDSNDGKAKHSLLDSKSIEMLLQKILTLNQLIHSIKYTSGDSNDSAMCNNVISTNAMSNNAKHTETAIQNDAMCNETSFNDDDFAKVAYSLIRHLEQSLYSSDDECNINRKHNNIAVYFNWLVDISTTNGHGNKVITVPLGLFKQTAYSMEEVDFLASLLAYEWPTGKSLSLQVSDIKNDSLSIIQSKSTDSTTSVWCMLPGKWQSHAASRVYDLLGWSGIKVMLRDDVPVHAPDLLLLQHQVITQNKKQGMSFNGNGLSEQHSIGTRQLLLLNSPLLRKVLLSMQNESVDHLKSIIKEQIDETDLLHQVEYLWERVSDKTMEQSECDTEEGKNATPDRTVESDDEFHDAITGDSEQTSVCTMSCNAKVSQNYSCSTVHAIGIAVDSSSTKDSSLTANHYVECSQFLQLLAAGLSDVGQLVLSQTVIAQLQQLNQLFWQDKSILTQQLHGLNADLNACLAAFSLLQRMSNPTIDSMLSVGRMDDSGDAVVNCTEWLLSFWSNSGLSSALSDQVIEKANSSCSTSDSSSPSSCTSSTIQSSIPSSSSLVTSIGLQMMQNVLAYSSWASKQDCLDCNKLFMSMLTLDNPQSNDKYLQSSITVLNNSIPFPLKSAQIAWHSFITHLRKDFFTVLSECQRHKVNSDLLSSAIDDYSQGHSIQRNAFMYLVCWYLLLKQLPDAKINALPSCDELLSLLFGSIESNNKANNTQQDSTTMDSADKNSLIECFSCDGIIDLDKEPTFFSSLCKHSSRSSDNKAADDDESSWLISPVSNSKGDILNENTSTESESVWSDILACECFRLLLMHAPAHFRSSSYWSKAQFSPSSSNSSSSMKESESFYKGRHGIHSSHKKTFQLDKFKRWCIKYICPMVIRYQMTQVSACKAFGSRLKVSCQSSSTQNTITAVYRMDEVVVELKLDLPQSYPLVPLVVQPGRRVGVDEANWRKWQLSTQAVLCGSSSGNSIMDGLLLWRDNANRRFEGISDCSVCFSILHPTEHTLPNKTCRQCNQKFHNVCLYKWFASHGQPTCPLCRGVF